MNIISPFLNNFSILVYDILNNNNQLNLDVINENQNNWSLSNVFFEILDVCSRNINFQKHLLCISDIFMKFADFFEFKSLANNPNKRFYTTNICVIIDIVDILLNFNKTNNTLKSVNNSNLNTINSNPTNMISLQEFPEFILIACSKLLHFVLLNFESLLEEIFVKNTNINQFVQEKNNFILELFELYKSLSIFYFSYELNCSKLNGEDNTHQSNIVLQIKKSFEIYNETFDVSQKLFLGSTINNEELFKLIEKKILGLVDKTKSIDQLFKLQLLIRLNATNSYVDNLELESFVLNLVQTNSNNKKLIFIILSLLFNNSLINLCNLVINGILDLVFQSVATSTTFTIEEICTLYRDNYKLKTNDDITIKIDNLIQFHVFIVKYWDKFEELVLQDNIEWMYIQLYSLFERNLLTKNSKEYHKANSIFDEINLKKKSNKSYIIIQLTDLILKKKILIN